MASRIDYTKLPLWRLKEARDAIERDEAGRNRVGPLMFSSRTIERLDRIHDLIRNWPRPKTAAPAEGGSR